MDNIVDDLVIWETESPIVEEDDTDDTLNNEGEEDLEEEKLTPKQKRYKEQLEGERKDAERLKNIAIEAQVKLAKANGENLLDLHKTDPKLAKEVSERFNWKDTKYGSYENFIKGTTKSQTSVVDVEAEVNKRLQVIEHEKAIKKAKAVMEKLPEGEREKAIAYFDKISKGQTFSDDTEAVEMAEIASLYVSKDKMRERKKEEITGYLGSGSVTWASLPTDDSKWHEVVRDGKLVFIPNKK